MILQRTIGGFFMRGICYRRRESKSTKYWNSHLTLAEYCRRNHLNIKTASQWRKRLRPDFVPDVTKSKAPLDSLEIVPFLPEPIPTSSCWNPEFFEMCKAVSRVEILNSPLAKAGNEADGNHLTMLSVFADTCRKNKVNFRRWLEDILFKLSATPAAEFDLLLWHGAD